ncbi:histidine kinase,HAMP domain-containing protein,histidine kinase [Desulfosporosinus youngiae DSM 17734]|uniref:histidine kinase n=1 Tax=Desulfosporosinus youngiae DSM 17734 TaxID=768710 RepID=H5XSS0_9FIRM|nr:ATP-binding protein [Desulfosporosinus youngiae]EHQ87738.1 histidine kinase,HAMP domain-containing protein,histidine kinase [Desulfosporosinus youngiae DSM 17734]
MKVHKKLLLSFKEKSLANQLVTIFAIIMLVPLLALMYDIFFASQTDQVIFFDKEQRLAALVNSTNQELTLKLESLGIEPEDTSSTLLHNEFTKVVEPYIPSNSGIRFGLYVPQAEKITVLGFLHNYRNLSPAEETQREKDIFANTKSSLVAAEMGNEPLVRISGSLNDQVVEYISPVVLKGKVVAVMWAGERLNPFFYESSFYRKLLRYFTLGVLALVMFAALRTIRTITTGVDRLKRGLHRMEYDMHHLLPEMSGELGQVAQAVNRMAESLSEKERLEDQLRQSEHLIALGRLATGVAHELRNPIGIIKTLVDLMKQEYSQMSGIEEYTRAIDEQVDRQDMVIQELLDFGRPTKVAIKECSINDLIMGVLSFSAAMLRKQKVKVQLELDDNLPKILADTEKLKQVFVNIIVNAAEAMPFGGNLDIKTSQSDDLMIVSLTDTGEGISEEELHRIFDPFYTTKDAGTGLGLSISYQSIKLHGGMIEVDSAPNSGTTFIIKLPISP